MMLIKLIHTTSAPCLHSGVDSGAHARKSPARFNVVISGRGGGSTNRSVRNGAQLRMPSHALVNIVNMNKPRRGFNKYDMNMFSASRDVIF